MLHEAIKIDKARAENPYFPKVFDRVSDEDWPLLRRAWVHQERRLSPRILHFLKNRLVWECNSTIRSETSEIDEDWTRKNWSPQPYGVLTRRIAPFKAPQSDTATAWRSEVAYYSQLKLTVEKDRLPAIAAIVERMMRTRKNDTYIAGMWETSFLIDAAWYCKVQHVAPRRDVTTPSWSWISAAGAVDFNDVTPLPCAEVISYKYTNIGAAHMGDVRDASVVLCGYVPEAQLGCLKDTLYKNGRSVFGTWKPAQYILSPKMTARSKHLKPML